MSDNGIKRRTIYCISNGINKYVGSTARALSERFAEHKYNAKTLRDSVNNKLYKRMNDVGLDAWKIIPLLVLNCSKEKIRHFEKKWMQILDADLNTYSPLRTEEENKQREKEQKAKYYKQNSEKIRQQQKEYNLLYFEKNIQEKRFYCSTCDKAFRDNFNLNCHLDTLKHAYANLNSVD